MKLEKLIFSFMAGLVLMVCVNTKTVSKEKFQKNAKPVCITEKCLISPNPDAILDDPLSKSRFKDFLYSQQELHALAISVYGARIKSHVQTLVCCEDLHIRFRQLLL